MNCHVPCNAKCKLLGALEQKIMNVLWNRSEPLKPVEIVHTLSDNHAYTTITTVLKRMTDKKLITRRLKGNVFVYQAVKDKTAYASECLDDLFLRLFDTYGPSVTTSFEKIKNQVKKLP